MDNNLINCSHIIVHCVENDPVDIKLGGPMYLRFDFYVKESEAQHMKKFIILTLERFNIPLIDIGIYIGRELNQKDVDDKERIVEAIQKDANYLKTEAGFRNHKILR